MKQKLIEEIKNLVNCNFTRHNHIYSSFNNIYIATYFPNEEPQFDFLKRIIIYDKKIEINFNNYTDYHKHSLKEFSLLDLQYIKIKLYEKSNLYKRKIN